MKKVNTNRDGISWKPFIPSGAVIKDPCLTETKESFPRIVYIPLSVCKKIDKTVPCKIFWNMSGELPPIPLELIWALINQDDTPLPSHAYIFKKAIAEANYGIAILKKTSAPGYFEVHPWIGTQEEANAIIND